MNETQAPEAFSVTTFALTKGLYPQETLGLL